MGKNEKRLDNLENLIKVWWSNAKFKDAEKADRLFQEFLHGSDKFLSPFMAKDFQEDASANWERIKTKYGLRTQTNREQNIRNYEDKAQRHYEQQTPDQIPTQTMRPQNSGDTIDHLGNWEIQEALATEWTRKEKNPPKGSGYSDWLSTMSLPLSDKLRQVLEHITDTHEYNQQQATRRLLRFGTQDLRRFLQEDIVHGEASLEEYRTAGKRAARWVRGASHGYSTLDEKVEVETNFGTRSSGKQSYKIVWNQKRSIEWVASQIGITEADAFRWALTRAGYALTECEQFPEALAEDIASITGDLEDFAERRAQNIQNSAKIAIREAFEQGYGSEIGSYCLEETPALWEEFTKSIEETYRKIQEIESEESSEEWLGREWE